MYQCQCSREREEKREVKYGVREDWFERTRTAHSYPSLSHVNNSLKMSYQAYGGVVNSSSGVADQNRKIFLGGLSYHTTDETLRAFCGRFGKYTDCLVMRNPEGKSRGFGFVTYEDESAVEDFMRSRPHTIDNRQIDPKRAMPREDQNSSEAHLTVKKLFVAGLRDGIDQESLREYFTRFGNVTEVLVMKDRDGKPRGFAFVSFDDYDAVDKAILGKPHSVNGRPLDIKKAIPKEKMQDMGPPSSGNDSSSNRNYSGGNGPRNNYPPARDNYSGNWDNQGGMPRTNNQNYNQPPMSSYPPQGYGSTGSSYNPSMSAAPNNGYPSSYSTNMAQTQPQSIMGYDSYNTNSNTNSGMPFNNNTNPNYLAPPPPALSSYGSNQQQGYGNMNNPFNVSAQPTNTSGYNDVSSSANPYGNGNSYGMMSQNYGSNSNDGSYNSMPQQPSRGGGPMRGGRGGGSGYNGNSDASNFGARPAPYTTRGGRGGGRGRGRGQ